MRTLSGAVSSAVFAVAVLIADAACAGAQSLASRVASAPDGVVHMQLEGRAGVCGDGRDLVGYRNAIFGAHFQSFGRWNSDNCAPGPLRVSLTVADGQVTHLRTQVGGQWAATQSRVTDLGVVPALDASAYFFSLVPQLERSRGNDRMLIPAVLAADVPVLQPLLALARDSRRTDGARKQAVQWLGILGDASVVPSLAQFARGEVDEDGDDRNGSIASGAMVALSMLEGGVGVPALIELAQSGSEGRRRNAVFWLGQTEDPRARRMLHGVIEDGSVPTRVRAHAVFSLTHGAEMPSSEWTWLRNLYARLTDDAVKEAIIQGMQEDESDGGRWLIERALDTRESMKLRKSALFWAGQRDETPTAELLRVYREAGDFGVREHAIFVLSQRDDDAAVNALLGIARAEGDKRLREKALFWLGQSDDPRARRLIADLVLN